MRRHVASSMLFSLGLAFCSTTGALASSPSQPDRVTTAIVVPQSEAWTASKVQHVYGLPETKPNDTGRLAVNSDGLTFSGKSSTYTIPRSSLIAVSSGNERVELWGMKGRLVRMAIPNGGGLAAAGIMHHKTTMLTTEFRDGRGGYHAAVFYVPEDAAARVLASFSQSPLQDGSSASDREETAQTCQSSSSVPRSVLIADPIWNGEEVPAAYKALVYEHVIDRVQRIDGVVHVYRAGEVSGSDGCPQYTLTISIVNFKQGSQVKRAVMGPAGFFFTKDSDDLQRNNYRRIREVECDRTGESDSARRVGKQECR
jgi:hypothetical protein